MGKHIYVFSVEDRECMIAKGYTLLHSDKSKNVYVFLNRNNNDKRLVFNNDLNNSIKFVESDTLIF